MWDGAVIALAHLNQFGQDTIYDHVLEGCDKEEVIKAARRSGNMHWSGISEYLKRKKLNGGGANSSHD